METLDELAERVRTHLLGLEGKKNHEIIKEAIKILPKGVIQKWWRTVRMDIHFTCPVSEVPLLSEECLDQLEQALDPIRLDRAHESPPKTELAKPRRERMHA